MTMETPMMKRKRRKAAGAFPMGFRVRSIPTTKPLLRRFGWDGQSVQGIGGLEGLAGRGWWTSHHPADHEIHGEMGNNDGAPVR